MNNQTKEAVRRAIVGTDKNRVRNSPITFVDCIKTCLAYGVSGEILKLVEIWNLSTTLEDQSEEVWQFLADLLINAK